LEKRGRKKRSTTVTSSIRKEKNELREKGGAKKEKSTISLKREYFYSLCETRGPPALRERRATFTVVLEEMKRRRKMGIAEIWDQTLQVQEANFSGKKTWRRA